MTGSAEGHLPAADGLPLSRPRLVSAQQPQVFGDLIVQTRTVSTPRTCDKCGTAVQPGEVVALVEFEAGRPLGWMCNRHESEPL